MRDGPWGSATHTRTIEVICATCKVTHLYYRGMLFEDPTLNRPVDDLYNGADHLTAWVALELTMFHGIRRSA